MLIAQGAHPKAIQSHLGHQSITTTLDSYRRLFADVHEGLAERVDDASSGVLRDPGSARSPDATVDRSAVALPVDRRSDWTSR